MKNIYLKTIASVMNLSETKLGEGIPVSISVKGMLICGDIITKVEFFEKSKSLQSLRERLAELDQEYGSDGSDENDELVLYLKNASYLPNGQNVPFNSNSLIMVEVSSIDAFNMGKFAME
ncbi:hypothetical protein [Acinetobacter radioresistens]|uniref:hypothetical protein n=1 Tax=Acinetobacter radioresistens TaxID=40216 RepID=UPI0021CD938F|nr:hypothetical protein [Acinetobacter radioresistens]MCU4567960.1 hypothetical protein [Acinetobacter radioresistens]